jgi:[protein-PII] uridylyltransferase
VDLLILYDRSSTDFSKFLAKELIYLLWDIGLKVGHSWRTAQQCLEMARADSSAENSLLDARHLAGSRAVFDAMRSLLRKHWSSNPRAFVERIRFELEERYGKLGETVFLIEPNVKESPGGLRDFHTMLWLTQGAWGLETEEEWVRAGILSEKDRERARRGYNWILRARNELHYFTGRRADQLTLALQPEVAAGLKVRPERHQQPSEVFMRHYFQHAEAVHQVMRLVLAAALREKGKSPRSVPLELLHGLPLVQIDSELRLAENGRSRFPQTPLDMMRVFPLAQQLQLRLGEDLQDVVRNHLSLVRRSWQRDSAMSAIFLAMLRRPGSVASALRSMHSCGFLGKYLPEFGHVTRLMQHDWYHRYTTDEHTLRAVERLDEIWRQPPPSLERYRDLTYHIADPAPLYLGLLLHDIGKGLGGGHSEKGAQRAAAICERLGFEPKRAAQVELLVRQHLLLSHLSQRRDLSDRRVAQQAAEIVGDLETLSMLCLLTYADTAGVSPDTWTEWKNSLLWELFERVHGEFLGLEAATAQEEEKLRELRMRVLGFLQGAEAPELSAKPLSAEVASEWMEEHLALLPRRYLLGYRPDLVARQILLAKQVSQTGPAVAFIPVEEEGYTLLLLCCPDTRGLFAKVAGTLAALEVNILGARLETREDGLAADVLWISTPRGNVISDPAQLRRIGSTVEGVVRGTVNFEQLTSRIRPEPLGPATKRPQLSLNNEISENCTVLEILAPDRLGLAYSMARCLTGLGLNIAFAKLATEKTMAFDVFYLTETGGGKLAEDRWEAVLSQLQQALQLPVAAPPLPSASAAGRYSEPRAGGLV